MDWLDNIWNKATNVFDKYADFEIKKWEFDYDNKMSDWGAATYGPPVAPTTMPTSGFGSGGPSWLIPALALAGAAYIVTKA